MASKIYDFGNKGMVLTIEFGELGTVVFKNGVAVVHKEELQEKLEVWLESTSAGMYQIKDYDPSTDKMPVRQLAGTQQGDNLVQGIMTSLGKNPAVAELDSQLAQALVSGSVDELVASNPEVLSDVGFVPNQEPEAAKPAKPVLGKK